MGARENKCQICPLKIKTTQFPDGFRLKCFAKLAKLRVRFVTKIQDQIKNADH